MYLCLDISYLHIYSGQQMFCPVGNKSDLDWPIFSFNVECYKYFMLATGQSRVKIETFLESVYLLIMHFFCHMFQSSHTFFYPFFSCRFFFFFFAHLFQIVFIYFPIYMLQHILTVLFSGVVSLLQSFKKNPKSLGYSQLHIAHTLLCVG